MIRYTANEAKQNLGRVMDEALQGPVSITRHGRPVVVVSADADYQEYLEFKYGELKEAVRAGFAQLERGERSSRSVTAIAAEVARRHSTEG